MAQKQEQDTGRAEPRADVAEEGAQVLFGNTDDFVNGVSHWLTRKTGIVMESTN